jgi:hypothetical protein
MRETDGLLSEGSTVTKGVENAGPDSYPVEHISEKLRGTGLEGLFLPTLKLLKLFMKLTQYLEHWTSHET